MRSGLWLFGEVEPVHALLEEPISERVYELRLPTAH